MEGWDVAPYEVVLVDGMDNWRARLQRIAMETLRVTSGEETLSPWSLLMEARDVPELELLHEYDGGPMGFWIKGQHVEDRPFLGALLRDVIVPLMSYGLAGIRDLDEVLQLGPIEIKRTTWVGIDTPDGVQYLEHREDEADVIVEELFPLTWVTEFELAELYCDNIGG